MSNMQVSYDIATEFPSTGVHTTNLVAELIVVLGASFNTMSSEATGVYDDAKGYVSGTLVLNIPQAFTAQDETDVATAMAAHTGVDSNGTAPVLATLLAASDHRGVCLWVEDCPRTGGGTGCPVYSDGTDWRRTSDDGVVRNG